MNKFKSMMAGKERLVITYWIWGVLGTIVVSSVLGVPAGLFGLPVTLVYILVLGYWVPVAMGIWRSSSAYKGNQIWAILAKVAIGLGVLNWLYTFSSEF